MKPPVWKMPFMVEMRSVPLGRVSSSKYSTSISQEVGQIRDESAHTK
jgi:hypothetical protein